MIFLLYYADIIPSAPSLFALQQHAEWITLRRLAVENLENFEPHCVCMRAFGFPSLSSTPVHDYAANVERKIAVISHGAGLFFLLFKLLNSCRCASFRQ